MSYSEIRKELKELGWPDGKFFGKKKTLKDLKHKIYEATSFLSKDVKTTFRIYCILNDIHDVPTCKTCGTKVTPTQNISKTSKYDTYVFATYCSRDCMRVSPSTVEKRMKTIVDRYGDHNMRTEKGQEEYKQGIIEKYGVEHVMHVPEIAERSLKDVNGNWRVTSDDFKKKQKEAWSKYDGGHPMRDPRILDKLKEQSLEKYGVENHTQKHISDESMKILTDAVQLKQLYETHKDMGIVADLLGVHRSSIQRAMTRLNIECIPYYESKAESEICSFLDSLDVIYEKQYRFDPDDKRSSCDIFVPSANLAIEHNGVYYHSSAVKKDKKFHQTRSLRMIELGLTPLHIWEDDWKNPVKRTIIENKIKHKLGLSSDRVYARQCEICFLESSEARDFLDQTHIQGKTTASHWIGLIHNNEIVACTGFKEIEKNSGIYDLVRYSTVCSVVGGLSKCIKFFEREVGFKTIITYAHLDYSSGTLYDATGFTRIGITPPGLWYVIKEQRIRREKFMKHKLDKILDNFDESLTERENMRLNGYPALFDSGSIKYVLHSS